MHHSFSVHGKGTVSLSRNPSQVRTTRVHPVQCHTSGSNLQSLWTRVKICRPRQDLGSKKVDSHFTFVSALPSSETAVAVNEDAAQSLAQIDCRQREALSAERLRLMDEEDRRARQREEWHREMAALEKEVAAMKERVRTVQNYLTYKHLGQSLPTSPLHCNEDRTTVNR
ncbi:hypothetical protein KFL_002400100 [Klebsormidium nitens]|uniref:Uncharacterized protein n=1 Tax=Klebsormidium nitens TaxID=105231 RepID=A0A1Y1IBS3_KLENI|nr:hypothetical protein KFL_002400100 [Klebsormidium nitens]|eukprot:GAQ85538.1 hypothetical protein KFL_002400100 [Klebsormidium nitens]